MATTNNNKTKFAADTQVTPDRTREEISKLLKKYGASSFAYWDKTDCAIVGFELRGRKYRFIIKFEPLKNFYLSASGKPLGREGQQKAHEQHIRSRWRAMLAVVKGKLIAVDAEIESFEEAFLRYTVMPGGEQTIGEVLEPALEQAYRTGTLPPMLQAGK